MTPPLSRLAGLCLASGLLAGCVAINPWWRPGTWQAQGVNDHNIAGLVQNPRDLTQGQSASGPGWRTGAAAVRNLWHDRVKPLGAASAPAAPEPAAPPGADNAGSAADAGQQPDGGS